MSICYYDTKGLYSIGAIWYSMNKEKVAPILWSVVNLKYAGASNIIDLNDDNTGYVGIFNTILLRGY